MIVELFGCPGSGKTYVLESMDNKHKNTTQDSKVRRWLKRICKSLILFSPCAFEVRKCILSKIDPLKYQSSFQTSSIKRIVSNISMLASVYKYTKKEWYIDEGIIHRIINLCVSYGIPKEIMYEIIVSLKDIMKEVTPYFLDTSVDICYESILARGRHEASIDFVRGEELRLLLRKYYEYCSYIAAQMGYKRISREQWKEEIL